MRLDSSAPPVLLADRASNGWQQEDQPFMVVGINLPTLGCWKITARYQDAQVSYVVWVTQQTGAEAVSEKTNHFHDQIT
jgi:hypothetical protein